jgi:Uma2 family endonuclease
MLMGRLLGNYLERQKLGIVLGEAGMLRLSPGLVRIPDVSFIGWDRLPGPRLPREPIWGLAPHLAVEVISRSNTPQEMQRKLAEYFELGVRLVWYVYPESRTVEVYAALDRRTVLGENDVLDGGDVLPGFQIALKDFFAEPGEK